MSLCRGLTSISDSTGPTELLLSPQTCSFCGCSHLLNGSSVLPDTQVKMLDCPWLFSFSPTPHPASILSTLAHSLCSSHMGSLTAPPTYQTQSCPRAFALAVLSASKPFPQISMGHTPNFLYLCPNVTFAMWPSLTSYLKLQPFP